MDPVPLWVLGGIGLFFSIFFSIGIGALQSYSRIQLEARFRSQAGKNRVRAYMERSERTLLSVRVLNALANILLVICITFLTATRFSELWVQVVLSLVFSLFIVAIVGGVLPGALARRKAEKTLKLFFPLYDAASRAIWPFTIFVSFIVKIAMRIAGIREKENGEEEIEKGILEAVSEGEREGYIKHEDRSMIASILDFRDEDVSAVMTPRTEMVSIPEDSTLGDAIEIAREKGHSRIPVHKGSRDDIIGVVYVKDILFSITDEGGRDKPVTEIMRKPFFVPESKSITSLLRLFQEGSQHMAIVLDEYGGTAGLITVEDIIEEIVGEIADEYDTAEEDFNIKKLDDNSAVASGVCRIDDVNEELEITLPEDHGYDTVGGFISHSMGRIPNKGENYTWNGTSFAILEADERRIIKVKITVTEAHEEED